MSKKIKRDLKNWYPICITRTGPTKKAYGHNVSGHLMPCCWCFKTNDPDINVLNQEHLKIENVDSIEEIVLSDEWLKFTNTLANDPLNAPKTCWKYCGKGKGYAIKKHETYEA
tara:strand:+ start:558 stop:896 length:339 start_codon:yes stop_codon:yes gene_type:complete